MQRWIEESKNGCYSTRSLALARNWIYARHGYAFKDPELRAFFQKQPWYTPTRKNVDALIGPREKAALKAIGELERDTRVLAEA